MSRRFFVEQRIRGPVAELTGAEATHLVRVMRAQKGDKVVLFDGTGAEFSARITQVSRNRVELAVGDREETSRELSFRLTLAVVLPKGDRQKWLVEKAVELGVAHIVPIASERAVAQVTESARGRLQRAVIEASKQCGRNMLMEIASSQSLEDFLVSRAAAEQRLIAHPEGAPLGSVKPGVGNVTILVGPEGGFSDEEVSRATAAGWQAIGLGPRILRVETAAIGIAAYFSLADPFA